MKVEKSAIIIATGKQIRVFKKLNSNVWINKQNPTQHYKSDQLKIVSA